MKKITSLFNYCLDFLTLSNLYISICAFFFTLQTSLFFKESNSKIISFALLNALAVFFIYNLQRFYYAFRKNKVLNSKDAWYVKHKYAIIILFAASLTASSTLLLSVISLLLTHWTLCLIPLFISVFYFMPPLKLREKPFLKPFLISFCWVFVCTYLPLHAIDAEVFSDTNLPHYMLAQFAFFSAACIPFDIRDVEIDKPNSVSSIPVLLGINMAKTISILLFCLYFFIGIMLFGKEVLSLGFLLVAVVASVFVVRSTLSKSAYYYSVLGDGLILFQFAIFQLLFY